MQLYFITMIVYYIHLFQKCMSCHKASCAHNYSVLKYTTLPHADHKPSSAFFLAHCFAFVVILCLRLV